MSRVIWHTLYGLAITSAISGACGPKKSSGGNKGGGSSNGTATSVQQSNNPNTPAVSGQYFTGFDGTHQFSVLVPSFKTFSVADPTIAKVETVPITITSDQYQKISDALAKACPNTDLATRNSMMGMFGRARSVQRITALKPGTTTITASAPAGQPGGPKGGGGNGRPPGGAPPSETTATVGDPCKPNFASIQAFGNTPGMGRGGAKSYTLTVNSYSPDQIADGQKRYETDLDNLNPACSYCHQTGRNGAPSHALGDVAQIPDADTATWITTGVLGKRSAQAQARIPHAWKFATDQQKANVVAYLRTLGTSDAEQLLVEEFNAMYGIQIDSSIVTGAPNAAGTANSP